MLTELYRKWRPTNLKQVYGQPEAVSTLKAMFDSKKIDHALCFVGPSGCGKTTLARITALELGAIAPHGYKELNAADFRGVDTVRDIRGVMGQSPLTGKTKCWYFDEAHKLTNDAQTALLKMLEDPPDHVYFMLATTDQSKLIKTIRNRCTPIVVNLLDDDDQRRSIERILKKEKKTIPEKVLDKIIDMAEGSARWALVLLKQVIGIEDPKEQLRTLRKTDPREGAFALVQQLMPFQGKPDWRRIARVLTDIEDQEPEGIRQLVLKTCRTHLLRGGKMAALANWVVMNFEEPFHGNTNDDRALLASRCYQIVHSK